MFDNFKAMGALAGLMKNKEKLREAGERVRAKMETTRVIGEAGAGAARAVATGSMRILEVELTSGLIVGMAADEKTRALAGNLIAEACNEAIRRAQIAMKEAVDEEAKALGLDGIPGLENLLQ
ncbi:MAG: YbaB/EbfC family nucleoid-associated protein [Planctomycetes bacterium]|nr:YbaB/EbfC family nucleoid-associated protein [Planctomycetota bacterium]